MGKTIATGQKSSKVHLITDKNFAVSVKVGDNMDRAIFKPDFGQKLAVKICMVRTCSKMCVLRLIIYFWGGGNA